MNIEIVLIVVSYIILLVSPILLIVFEDYNMDLNNGIEAGLQQATLSLNTKTAMEESFLTSKLRYIVFPHAAKILYSLIVILTFINNYWLMSKLQANLQSDLLVDDFWFCFLLCVIGTGFVCGIIYFIAREMDYNNSIQIEVNVNALDIHSNYINKKYPELASILIPIYKYVHIKDNRSKLETRPIRQKDGRYLSRFGKSLVRFEKIFEDSLYTDCAKSLFKYEVLDSDKVELLAKLTVILEDPLLIEELVFEDETNEIAKEFNDSLSGMLDNLEEKIIKAKELDIELKDNTQFLEKQLVKKQTKEKLELLVKQSFDTRK